MRTRILIAVSLGILLIQGPGVAQEQPAAPSSDADEVVKIVAVKHYPVQDLAAMLNTLSGGEGTHIIVDPQTDRLIIQAAEENVEKVLDLIGQLDVPGVSESFQSLTCRIYMLEVPPKDPALRPFALVLSTPVTPSSQEMMEAVEGPELRIAGLLQIRTKADTRPRIVIQGRAASQQVVKRIADAFEQSTISELKWEDEGVLADVPAAQVAQLPGSLPQHVRKFLGTEVRTVGYWFGHVSLPVEVAARIGPWEVELEGAPVRTDNVSLEIKVTQESPVEFIDAKTVILSNTVQGRVGKPIVIGYNRDRYGTRTMGAMVVLLEADETDEP